MHYVYPEVNRGTGSTLYISKLFYNIFAFMRHFYIKTPQVKTFGPLL